MELFVTKNLALIIYIVEESNECFCVQLKCIMVHTHVHIHFILYIQHFLASVGGFEFFRPLIGLLFCGTLFATADIPNLVVNLKTCFAARFRATDYIILSTTRKCYCCLYIKKVINALQIYFIQHVKLSIKLC